MSTEPMQIKPTVPATSDRVTATIPVNTARRDWFRILRDLMAVGVSYSEVGRKTNRNTSTVRSWADGGDPKEADARVILALYAKHCPLQYVDHHREFAIRLAVAEEAEAAAQAEARTQQTGGAGEPV